MLPRAQFCDSPKDVLTCRHVSDDVSAYEAAERLTHPVDIPT